MPNYVRKFWLCSLAVLTAGIVWTADWPMPAGGPQRNGWAKAERLINRSNVGQLQLLYKYQAQNVARGLNSLTPPIINGNLITYLGFKEMLIFGGSSNKIFSVDADLNKIIWQSDIAVDAGPPAEASATCPGGMTAPVLMAGNSSATMHFASEASRTAAAAGVPVRRPSPYFPPLSQSIYPLRPTTLTQLAAIYTVSSDGNLHVVNSSTGQDLLPAMRFVPPNANVTSLNLHENIVYATTGYRCDGYSNAIYSFDLLSNPKKINTFPLQRGAVSGAAGTAIGNDGTIYAEARYAPGNSKEARDTILALTPKDLTEKDYFAPEDKDSSKNTNETSGITPLVFRFKGRDLVVAGARNGRVYLLDSKSLGGADHRTPIFATDPIARVDKKYAGYGFRGTFSSWVDVSTGTRWIYAPLIGPPNAKSNRGALNGAPISNGGIVAFKFSTEGEQLALQPVWLSEDLAFPASPVIANGMVYVLCTGESPRLAKQNGQPYTAAERKQMSTKAKLVALDAFTGKELYSSGDTAGASSPAGGLAVANGRVYFTTSENFVYCFGFLKGQKQLTEE